MLQRARTIADEGTVPSPCLSICRMDSVTEYCEGCMRTLDEIAAWSTLPDEGKRGIWNEIARRAREQA